MCRLCLIVRFWWLWVPTASVGLSNLEELNAKTIAEYFWPAQCWSTNVSLCSVWWAGRTGLTFVADYLSCQIWMVFYYNRWNVVCNTRVTWSDNQNVSCLCEQAVKKRQCQQVFWFKPFGVLTDASNKRQQRMLQTDIQERLCWWRAGCAELAHLMECLSCACCW